MIEQVHQFGPGDGLAGMMCAPDGASDIGVVMLNAGLIHKTGPGRMWVNLARRLSRRGITSLRFDFGGFGDSVTRRSGSYAEQVIAETQAALELHEERGQTRLYVLGLGSGAVNAHRIAFADDRVSGLIALDGFNWPTPEYYVRYYAPRSMAPKHWLQVAKTRLLAGQEPSAQEMPAIFEEEFPDKTTVAPELRTLVRRGTRMLYVFTGGYEQFCNYRGQLEDNFPDIAFGDTLRVERFPESDHTYTRLKHREQMFALVEDWLLGATVSEFE